jgi:hypothetical protein
VHDIEIHRAGDIDLNMLDRVIQRDRLKKGREIKLPEAIERRALANNQPVPFAPLLVE